MAAPSTAIDVLLNPDAAMIDRASSVNADLRDQYQGGFSLDAGHQPHISVVQCYVDSARLDDALATISATVGDHDLDRLRLTATGYYYIPWQTLGLAGIVAEPTDELLALQRSLLDAVDSYRVPTGDADAFVRPDDDPDINDATIDYIAQFDSLATGDRYNPHVTVGLAPADYIDGLIAADFDRFTFGVTGASTYQLGNFGTASRLLRDH